MRSAYAGGQDGGRVILVKYGMTECALAAQRSHRVRIFRQLRHGRRELRPEERHRHQAPGPGPCDEGRARRCRYTKWLKSELQEAIGDSNPTVPHDEAMRQVRAAIKLA